MRLHGVVLKYEGYTIGGKFHPLFLHRVYAAVLAWLPVQYIPHQKAT